MRGMNNASLLSEVEKFLAETGMSEGRFGFNAVRNSRLVERLRQPVTPKKGKPVRIWPETEMRVRAYMVAERQRREREGA